ncbi:vinculin-like isoform X4 [Varroa jacobsoni]|uniref:Vinculin n=1 Tax=Varroa destructor TaxID=109461 RepID=A0A7M7MA79_VARDE|nr:vinculin-like isoform X4 [Varroa destructor]XP_022685915.1 vinculin-like isoform X4 [Varroa jacobsoni]
MPVFHTKTIASILEPVSAQVERLVILHEEAEDGNAMPDLSRPVQAVSRAVTNLVKVGRDTISASDDPILRQDMPQSLQRVERSSKLLEEACEMLLRDPYSQPARKKLIEGSRGILQGTSSLLLVFDESGVRRIVRECRKVLDYLAVAEVIESIDDLVQFVNDMSPCLAKVSRDVDARQEELTHQVHRDILIRCLDSVKMLAPVLVCSMKIYVQIQAQGGKGVEEAAENRNYLTHRMSEEINEIIRVLQLTTYDEDEWESDNLTGMKRLQNAIQGRIQYAHDWLDDPTAMPGGVGEKSLRYILEYARRIAERALPADRNVILKACGDIESMLNALCELRSSGQDNSPQTVSLSRNIGIKLRELNQLINQAILNVERGGLRGAQNIAAKIEQALAWCFNAGLEDGSAGERAVRALLDEGRRIAETMPPAERAQIHALCNEIESMTNQLKDLCRKGLGHTPEAQSLGRALAGRLQDLKGKIQKGLVDRVVDDFIDVHTPLKQFVEAVHAPESMPGRETNFQEKARRLGDFSRRTAGTARNVAMGATNNKRLAEALMNTANNVESLTPQLISAGKIRMTYPDNKAADDHFENLRGQYEDQVNRMRNLADETTDIGAFVKATEDAIKRHTDMCEDSVSRQKPQDMVDNASAIARLGNRVLMRCKQECDNSEDPHYVARLQQASRQLETAIAPMIQNAKQVAQRIHDPDTAARWRTANNSLLKAVQGVRNAVSPFDDQMNNLTLNDYAPPRPPMPAGDRVPPRPPPPEYEDDDSFPTPQPNQPILAAAHGLHQEVRQWSSKDNEIIAAAKRMALLMARLSQLVRGEGGSKKELIVCAKAIAEASEEVTRLAKEHARLCTDRRMRTAILQVCERIPTIGGQLKILSTVKATMLGAQGSDEDREATEMLVGNAQNLMQSVKETVRACEAASIKIRTDAGMKLRWVRKNPWYQ